MQNEEQIGENGEHLYTYPILTRRIFLECCEAPYDHYDGAGITYVEHCPKSQILFQALARSR